MREYLIYSERNDVYLSEEGAVVITTVDESGGLLDGVSFEIPLTSDEATAIGTKLIELAKRSKEENK